MPTSKRRWTPCSGTESIVHTLPTTGWASALSDYLEGMPEVMEIQRAVRVMLLDVMEQCARHVDSCPQGRHRFERIASAAHDCLVEFESMASKASGSGLSHRGLYSKAQDRVLDWLLEMQHIRREYPLERTLEPVSDWSGPEWSNHYGQADIA